MEIGSVDCSEMVDYYPQFDGVCESEEEKSRLRWVIDAGLSLGKKIVITGFVVTSAPLILPPLVVVSALGCAFSVPFGVVFASYACTQKLMSKLLPPPPPLLLPYDENEEEREEMEDVKNGIDFVDYDEGLDGGDGFEIGYLEEYDEGIVNSDEIGRLYEEIEKQESCDENVYFGGTKIDDYGGDLELKIDDYGGDLEFQGQNNVGSLEKVDTLVENEDEKDDSERFESEDILQVEGDTLVENEGEKNISERIESEDLLQVEGDDTLMENEDEKNASESIESENLVQVQGDTLVGSEGEKNVLQTKENEDLVQVQDDTSVENEGEKNIPGRIGSEDLVQDQSAEVEMTTVATVRVADKDEKRRKGKRGKKKTVAAFKVPEKTIEPEGDNRHEKLSGEDKGVVVEKSETSSDNNLKLGEKICPEEVVQEESRGKLEGDKEKCIVLEGKKLDVEQVAVKHKRNEDVGNVESSLEKKNEPVLLKEISDVISIETNGGTISYKSTTVVVDTDTAEGNSVKVAKDDSVEGMQDDEEIWKKIDAIRVIVGFKAPRCASYFDELKAMYIFTGIEPPSDSSMHYSSSDSAASADFGNKLRFLMSVIGLK